MIIELQIKHFKAFNKHSPIELAPLTVIAGKNSSGKSSILHSLLLLKQTIEAESRPEALALEGAFLQYSQLKELTFGLPQLGACSIGFHIKVKDENKTGQIDFEVRHKPLPSNKDLKGIVVNTFKCEFRQSKNDETDAKKDIHNQSSDAKTSPLKFDSFTLKLINGCYEWPEGRPFTLELPPNFKQKESPYVDFDGFLPARVRQCFQIEDEEKKLSHSDTLKFPFGFTADNIDSIITRLRLDLKNIKYLGPVRALPKRAYVHYSSHFDLENDGSNAAQVLWLRQKEMVKWGKEKKPLLQAVNECLKMMGLAQSVSARQFQRIIYQLHVGTLADSAKKVTIADVGFGFSQLLPVILRGLLPPEGMILFEQPEIHLHPACAGRLADLFFQFVASGKQIVVETHSAELINRMRLLIVQGSTKINVCEHCIR